MSAYALTVAEAARRAGVYPGSLCRAAKRGTLATAKIGGTRFVTLSEVERWRREEKGGRPRKERK